MNQKGTILILIVLGIVFVVGITGVVVSQSLKPSTESSQSSDTAITNALPVSDQIPNWKTYTDKKSRFIFQYPPVFSIKEDVGGSGNIFYTDLESAEEKFRFEIGPKEYVGLYEHFSSNKTEEINGISWIVVLASEYCDAGECGPTAPGYYIKKDNYYVGILELKKKDSLQTLEKILSSFKFI